MKPNREIKPGPNIPHLGRIEGYAVIVDLNQFTPMVTKAEKTGDPIVGIRWLCTKNPACQ